MQNNNKKYSYIFKKHLEYILTLSITYLLGALICLLTYLMKYRNAGLSGYEIIQVVLDFLMPTTFTYLFCSGFSKIYNSTKRDSELWSWLVLVYSIAYVFIYLIYQLLWECRFMIAIVIILSIFGLILDLLSYKDTKLNVDDVLSA